MKQFRVLGIFCFFGGSLKKHSGGSLYWNGLIKRGQNVRAGQDSSQTKRGMKNVQSAVIFFFFFFSSRYFSLFLYFFTIHLQEVHGA